MKKNSLSFFTFYFITFMIVILVGSLIGCKAKKAVQSESVLAKPVKVIDATLKPFESKRKISATSYAGKDVIISSQANGVLEQVNVQLGDKITAGSVLAVVDPEMARAQLESASSNYQLALTNFQMQDQLYAKKLTSDQQYKTVKNQLAVAKSQFELAQLQFKNTRIVSPIDGILSAQYADQGEFIVTGKPVFNVVDISQIKVIIGVSGDELRYLQPQARVVVTFPTISDKPFIGTIRSIGTTAESSNQTFPIEIYVNNPNQRIKPGLLGFVQIIKAYFYQAVIIPQDAIIEDTVKTVFVVKDQKVYKKAIKVLGIDDDQVAVLGLQSHEKIVIVGQNGLSEGDLVKVIP